MMKSFVFGLSLFCLDDSASIPRLQTVKRHCARRTRHLPFGVHRMEDIAAVCGWDAMSPRPDRGSNKSAQGRGNANLTSIAVALGTDFRCLSALKGRNRWGDSRFRPFRAVTLR
jgi:hypothetical protein